MANLDIKKQKKNLKNYIKQFKKNKNKIEHYLKDFENIGNANKWGVIIKLKLGKYKNIVDTKVENYKNLIVALEKMKTYSSSDKEFFDGLASEHEEILNDITTFLRDIKEIKRAVKNGIIPKWKKDILDNINSNKIIIENYINEVKFHIDDIEQQNSTFVINSNNVEYYKEDVEANKAEQECMERIIKAMGHCKDKLDNLAYKMLSTKNNIESYIYFINNVYREVEELYADKIALIDNYMLRSDVKEIYTLADKAVSSLKREILDSTVFIDSSSTCSEYYRKVKEAIDSIKDKQKKAEDIINKCGETLSTYCLGNTIADKQEYYDKIYADKEYVGNNLKNLKNILSDDKINNMIRKIKDEIVIRKIKDEIVINDILDSYTDYSEQKQSVQNDASSLKKPVSSSSSYSQGQEQNVSPRVKNINN